MTLFPHRVLFSFLFILVLILISYQVHAAPHYNIEWEKIGDDLELAKVDYNSRAFLSTEITFLRSALNRFQLRVIRAADYGKQASNIKSLCKSAKAVACINANFFDEEGKALGLVVSRGIVHNRVHRGGKTLTGVFAVSRNDIQIKQRSDIQQELLVEAVQAGPRILVAGQAVQGLREPSVFSRRSGICIDAKKRIIMYVVSAGLFGSSIEQLQELLRHPALGCQDALNLDGGGSSQFFLSAAKPGALGGAEELLVPGKDDIPVALGLFLQGN